MQRAAGGVVELPEPAVDTACAGGLVEDGSARPLEPLQAPGTRRGVVAMQGRGGRVHRLAVVVDRVDARIGVALRLGHGLCEGRPGRNDGRVQDLVAEMPLCVLPHRDQGRIRGRHDRRRRLRNGQHGLGRQRGREGLAGRHDHIGRPGDGGERLRQQQQLGVADRERQLARRSLRLGRRVVDDGLQQVGRRQVAAVARQVADLGQRPAGLAQRRGRRARRSHLARAVERDHAQLGRRDDRRGVARRADRLAACLRRDGSGGREVGVEELLNGGLYLGRGVAHVGPRWAADVADEPHLRRARARDRGDRLGVAHHGGDAGPVARRPDQLDVGRDVIDQRQEVRADRPEAEPPLELAHERLLAREAVDVGVGVAVAHVAERLSSR